jgi:hypothetical protein
MPFAKPQAEDGAPAQVAACLRSAVRVGWVHHYLDPLSGPTLPQRARAREYGIRLGRWLSIMKGIDPPR